MESIISYFALISYMQTGFEIMDYDKNLKALWSKRMLAGIVDFVVTTAIAFLIVYFLIGINIIIFSVLQGPVWFLYSIIFDIINGKSVGKYIFRIKAVAFIGNLKWAQAILRNLTKLNFFIVLADAVVGLSTEGDPRQRYTERFIDTLVISEMRERRIKRFEVLEDKKEKEELELPR